MNSLKHIFELIETEQDASVRRSNKASFYTLLNYLESSHSGISDGEIQSLFPKRDFSTIFQALVDKSVVEESKAGTYVLNKQVKVNLSPILEELTDLIYKSNYDTKKSQDPTLALLYDARSQIFGS